MIRTYSRDEWERRNQPNLYHNDDNLEAVIAGNPRAKSDLEALCHELSKTHSTRITMALRLRKLCGSDLCIFIRQRGFKWACDQIERWIKSDIATRELGGCGGRLD